MLNSTRRLLWAGYWLLAVLLSLLALLVLMLRLLLPQLGGWTEALEQQLAGQLDARVQIGTLSGRWQGVSPVLQIEQLDIDQPERWQFTLERAEISLNLGQSLLQWRPVFTRLQLDQPVVTLWQPEPVAGPRPRPALAGGFALPVIPVWLLDQPLEISEGQVQWRRADKAPVTLRDIRIGLEAIPGAWQLSLSGQLGSDGVFRTLRGVVEGQGAPHRGTVRMYGELDGLAPTVLNSFLPPSFKLASINLKQQFWGQLEAGRLTELKALSDIRSLNVAERWQLEDTQLKLALQPDGNRYQWQLYDSQLVLNDARLELPVVAGDLVSGTQGWFLKRLKLPALSLDALTRFAAQQPLPEATGKMLGELNLRGQLENLQLQWPSPRWRAFELEADLSAVKMDAWQGVPQILGIDGRLEAGLTGGKIHLDSQDFTLNFPALFPQGWQYQQADGVVGWRLEADAATIYSELLHLKAPQIEANGRFSLMLPFDGGQTELTLMIGTRGADGRVTGQYVPPKAVGEATHNWLVEAIRAGTVRQGAFLLNGGTRSRLEGYQPPSVQMFFDVQQAEFAFQPEWPAVEEGEAFVLFKDGALSVDITRGRMMQSALQRGWVGLSAGRKRVDVVAGLKGDARDVKTLLTRSPLRAQVGDAFDSWTLKGPLVSELQLQIPLTKAAPEIHISSQLRDVQLHSEARGLKLDRINGEIRYDTPWGLNAEKLTATLFGHPATATIVSQPAKEFGNRLRTQVQLDSRVKIAQLKTWLQVPVLNIAQGETWYRARLNLCQGAAPGCTGLDIRSSLQGVEVVGPDVVAKQADDKVALRLTSDLGAKRQQVGLSYGDQVSGQFLLVDQALERGRIAFGKEPATLPPDRGLRVVGALEKLDLSALQVMLERAGILAEAETASHRSSGPPLLHSLALNIGRFQLGDTVLKRVNAVAQPVAAGWQLDVASETVTGRVLFPLDGRPYDIHLSHLSLARDPGAPSGADSMASPIDPKQLPRANVVVKNLRLNDKPMGAWSFALHPDARGATLRNIQGNLARMELQGEVRWDGVQRHESSLTMKITGGNMGDVLRQWGYGRVLENETVTAYLQMDWPGPPWAFRVGAASGESRFIVKKGRLLDTGAASNFLRIFGILNLDSLGRRLRLDFSDLYEQGIAFDRIGADYQLSKGVIRTREPFEMVGPSVQMVLNGSIDLEKETVDKRMEVSLPVTSNLPAVGLLLGAAPQVAGAVFLIDKLTGGQLQQFTAIRYKITGSWDNPQITLPDARRSQGKEGQKNRKGTQQ